MFFHFLFLLKRKEHDIKVIEFSCLLYHKQLFMCLLYLLSVN